MAKVKYPLTPEAKDAAKLLVDAWGEGQIPQFFTLSKGQVYSEVRGFSANIDRDFDMPRIDVLLELAQFKLITTVGAETLDESDVRYSFAKASDPYVRHWHFLLMQELRNAVATDFDVSDFFLTTQAVGTIINAAENSTVLIPALQSAASVFGDIDQTQINTPSELAAKLLQVLGKDVFEANPALGKAIQELDTVEPTKKKLQFGKVISELGRCISLISHASGAVQAILLLARFAASQGLW